LGEWDCSKCKYKFSGRSEFLVNHYSSRK
jgi:ribosomal protein L37AE/L43A